jgi:hypothetical protein
MCCETPPNPMTESEETANGVGQKGFPIETSAFAPRHSGYFRPVVIFRPVSRTATAGSNDRFFFR